jgi:hypothetical protein
VISGRSSAADKQKDRPVSASLDGPEYTVKAHFVLLFIVYHICSKSQIKLVGHCPRQAIFDAARYHPDHPLHVDPALRVGNDLWSGHIDFLIDPCQELPDYDPQPMELERGVKVPRDGKKTYKQTSRDW